jgi:hypothetical protein
MAVDRPERKRPEQRDPTRAWNSVWLPFRHAFRRDNAKVTTNSHPFPSPDSPIVEVAMNSVCHGIFGTECTGYSI